MSGALRRLFSVLVVSFCLAAPAAMAQDVDPPRQSTDQPGSEAFVLSPAFPNPFHPSTSFTLRVRDRQNVKVEVYNMLGQPIKLLYDGVMEAGETRTFRFEAGDLPSGIYLYRAIGQGFTATRQATLIR